MSHKSRLSGISIDCRTEDLGEASGFWSGVFGSRILRDEGKYHVLEDQSGLSCEVQAVDHDPRVHLDIETDDMEAEERRLTALGARRWKAIGDWVVMEAPTGHRFCIVPRGSPDFETTAKEWG